jgi:putative ABC transport system permease protein
LIEGRYFDQRDTLNSPAVIAISQSLARRYFSGQDPIGRRMKISGPDLNNPWMTIVGVVGDVKYTGLDDNSALADYLPASQSYNSRTFLMVRSTLAPSLAPEVRRKIHELDRDITIAHVNLMDDVISDSVAGPRFRAYLIGSFAVLALLLAAIGIYGVVSYSVAQRTSEIGIRAAMGATPANILWMVARQGLRLTMLGLAAGIAIALALTHLISTLLFGISATDIGTFAAVSALLSTVALLACLIPARRGMQVDPIVALRSE